MKEINPPKFAIRFLRWFCPPELIEGIEGDLLEQFDVDLSADGAPRARRRFVLNMIKFFRPSLILRNRFRNHLIENLMIRNYFNVALRNIAKRKLYSFINAIGLSVGIAFSVLIYLYIQDERSFDQFHANKNLIYRLESKAYDPWNVYPHEDPSNKYNVSAYLMTPLREALKDELPEVAFATRLKGGAYCIVRHGDNVFSEAATYVDADFFKMFSFKLLSGNRDKLFSGKLETVISQHVAKKYFGDEDPVGKVLEVDMEGNKEYIVTGVIEDVPSNSSISYSILLPLESFFTYERNLKHWDNFDTPCLVQLVPQTDLNKFKTNLDAIVQKYMGNILEKWRKGAVDPVPADAKMYEIGFTQLSDWHLKKEISWDKVSDPQYSLILGGIAALILLIASINYVSLALTTSASRRIEVGIRKVAGAQRSQLVWQFSIESLVLAILSMIIALGLVVLFLPAFNRFTGKAIEVTLSNISLVMAASLIITVLIGFVAGSYPSLFLSAFRPAAVLKGTFTSKMQAGFAKPLVVLQFALSAFLIMSSLIMYQQMKYVTTKDLGYNKDQILVMGTQTGFNKDANAMVERMRTRLQREPNIVSVAGTGISFAQGWSRSSFKVKDEQKAAYLYPVDPYYIPTMGLTLTQGRNFDPSITSDSTAVIVNEALVWI
jgi:putative ABC transport system permease protein